MAKAKTTVTAKDKSPAPVTDSAQKFTIERLAENSMRLFGVGISTYAGATYGLTGTYTVEEMRNIINEWKTQEVK